MITVAVHATDNTVRNEGSCYENIEGEVSKPASAAIELPSPPSRSVDKGIIQQWQGNQGIRLSEDEYLGFIFSQASIAADLRAKGQVY